MVSLFKKLFKWIEKQTVIITFAEANCSEELDKKPEEEKQREA